MKKGGGDQLKIDSRANGDYLSPRQARASLTNAKKRAASIKSQDTLKTEVDVDMENNDEFGYEDKKIPLIDVDDSSSDDEPASKMSINKAKFDDFNKPQQENN